MPEVPILVSPEWLREHLKDPAVGVIENAWVQESYDRAHIQGTLRNPNHPYLKGIDASGERTQGLMAGGAFRNLCEQLGLKRDRHYIVYDDYFGLFAARFWWVCRYFGMTNVSVLDGNWRGWLARGYPVSSRIESKPPGTDIEVQPGGVEQISLEDLYQNYRDPEFQIWDTRRPGEFTGEERSENARTGHVPGSLNLVWTDLLEDAPFPGGPRFLKSPETLRSILTALGLRHDRIIVTYCQSGIRAAFGNFILEWCGYPQHRLYDASMVEWANRADTPLIPGGD